MKYTDLSINLGFHRNMRETNWLKLFPHWWSSSDPLIKIIGEEVEHLKANTIFNLLNTGIKPPVLLWQNSLMDKEFHQELHMTDNEDEIVIAAPRYKTWGKITITNNSDNELYNFKVMINENDGLSFNDAFAPGEFLTIDLTEQKYTINNDTYIIPTIYGEGLPYFKISQYQKKYDPKIKLHNEAIKLKFSTTTILDNLSLDIDVQLNNVVFEDEQNIEITSFELLPIEKVDVFVNYDLPYNPGANGWKKAYTKEYDVETHVIYDMITIHHYTKQFYVEVWFKGLDYPYQVGFPCWSDEDEDSMFHINTRLDVWGELLGLPRRLYKEDIPEEEYYKTFPRFYPFDIEQDFWYYSRLVNEYAWNDLAIDEADILDSNEELVMRLHSINPFTEDFAIHARSYYPTEVENYNYKIFPHNSINDEEVLLKLVNNKPFIIILASKELKKDKEFVKKCAFLNPDSFNYVSTELKKNITFVKELLKKEPSILKYTCKSIRSNKELLKNLIKENIDFVKYIDSELYSDLEFMKELIKIDNSLSMYASESLLKNQDIAISYILNTKKYNWLSNELKCNKEFILKIVKIDPEVLLIIDDSLKNIEFYKEAVKINSNSIFFIDDELKDNDFLIELVKVNPYIVYYLYKNFNNNIDLLRRLVRVLSDYEKDDDALKNFKKDTSEVLKLELEKFD